MSINKYIVIGFLLLLALGLNAQTIPAGRLEDWSKAGMWKPTPQITTFKNYMNVAGANNTNTADNVTAINNAIAAFGGNMGLLYFPAGTYQISAAITIPSNIIIKGAGSDSTTFNFTHTNGNCFDMQGSIGSFSSVSGGYSYGSKTITVASTTGINVNDYIVMNQTNGSWYSNTLIQRSYGDDAEGQIFQVVDKTATTLTFDQPIRFSGYTAARNPKFALLSPVKNIGFEDIKVDRTAAMSASTASGTTFNFNYAVNSWLKGVESYRAAGIHVSLYYSKNIEVSGCYIHKCYRYDGTNATGYGIVFGHVTSDCLAQNNITDSLRHAIMFKEGANGNVAAYNYHYRTYRTLNGTTCNVLGVPCQYQAADIVFHGHFPYANLVEGHIGRYVSFDQEWGTDGPKNTLFRSRTIGDANYSYGVNISSAATQFFSTCFCLPSFPMDSFNIALNEITGGGAWNMYGTNHFICGNNVNGSISAEGSCADNTTASLFYTKQPTWWAGANWPPIGEPNAVNSSNNPAYNRYAAAGKLTINDNNNNKPVLGSLRFNTTTNTLEGYNGREWKDL